MNALTLWLILMLVFFIAYFLGMRNAAVRVASGPSPTSEFPPEKLAAFEALLTPMLAISGHKEAAGKFIEFYGRLRGGAEEMFRQIREAFTGESVTPILMEGDANDVCVLLLPQSVLPAVHTRPRWWLHWLLFVATIATTTWAGALFAGVDLLKQPGRFAVGLPYSLGLLLILGAHELGHYFTAKAHGIEVTPPFFIPVPFALGTFGAFIKIKSLTPNRRALFDVAVAGPLAGLVFAIPALLIGLRYSHIVPAGTTSTGISVSSSVLLSCLAKISLGASVSEGNRLLMHPLAFAGWLGLIVTALNLLPIGQLDGGHMSHALFGTRRAHRVSEAALVLLFVLALFVWQGLMFWAIIVFFIAGTRDAPAANDVTPMGWPRKALGYFTFLLLLLIIVPVPRALYQTIGVHSPYF
ncbi:MAG TPA: site-2 protease family protein [Chthoniobacteraceae bacterium]|jgi:membrane-associated protease RseP (regulator of RpoE activity)|nr:site-2 protease family protein [Chthoniobacteraceae bacterium]